MIPPFHLPLEKSDRAANSSESGLQGWVERMIPGGKLLRSWPLKGGISAAMTAFEAAWPGDGIHTLVLRQATDPQSAEREYKTLLVLKCLRLPAPFPMLCDPPYLITGYIEGAMDFAALSTDRIARQMATSLVKIHTADLASVNTHYLPDISERLAGELQFTPAFPNALMDETRVRRALTRTLPLKKMNPTVLLHGDYWPGNLLWHNDNLTGIIDWEDAALGDPLADLAIARLDLNWIFGAAAMHTFTEKYLSQNNVDLTDLPAWDIYAALRFIRLAGNDLPGWAAYFLPYNRSDITVEHILQSVHTFVDDAMHRTSLLWRD